MALTIFVAHATPCWAQDEGYVIVSVKTPHKGIRNPRLMDRGLQSAKEVLIANLKDLNARFIEIDVEKADDIAAEINAQLKTGEKVAMINFGGHGSTKIFRFSDKEKFNGVDFANKFTDQVAQIPTTPTLSTYFMSCLLGCRVDQNRGFMIDFTNQYKTRLQENASLPNLNTISHSTITTPWSTKISSRHYRPSNTTQSRIAKVMVYGILAAAATATTVAFEQARSGQGWTIFSLNAFEGTVVAVSTLAVIGAYIPFIFGSALGTSIEVTRDSTKIGYNGAKHLLKSCAAFMRQMSQSQIP